MRRPEGTCASCWQPHPPSQERCFGPPEATERTYGETTTDRLESFLLDAANPRQDVATRAHGFQIDEAKRLAGWLRSAAADGSLTADDFGLPASPSTPVDGTDGRPESDADQLREAAAWLDTYDAMARVFFQMIQDSTMSEASRATALALIPAASSDEVQTDLRRIAGLLDAPPAPPVSPPVAERPERDIAAVLNVLAVALTAARPADPVDGAR